MEISFAEAEMSISLHTKALLTPETAGRLYHPGDLYFSPISDTKFMTDDFNTFKVSSFPVPQFPLEMAMPLLSIFDRTV